MRLKIKLCQPFNLDLTLCSGQTFTWHKADGSWYGMIGSTAVKAVQDKDNLLVESDEVLDENVVLRYFGLKDDIFEIQALIDKDQYIHAALKAYQGLRIIRQDPWEALISFITATNTSIKRIKRIISKLCHRFGARKRVDTEVIYAFPTPQTIARAEEAALKEIGLGYRATWILEAAKTVSTKPDLIPRLAEQSYESARVSILRKERFKGVGDKVADCILLFGFGKLESFPIDRWVKRCVLRCYSYLFDTSLVNRLCKARSLSSREYNTIRLKMIDYFGRYAGYAQQYLFTYERLTSRSLQT